MKRQPVRPSPIEEEEEDDEEEEEEGSSLGASVLEEAVAAGVLAPPPPRAFVNNKDGLRQALSEFRQEGLPWIERLEVVSAEPLGRVDVNDDLKMELGFYGQALAAVIAARAEFDRSGVPHRRPDDFFAEMLKSDAHMKKIKDKLLFESKKMAAVEHRKKEKSSAVYAKEAAAEKLREKAAEKRATLDGVKQWQKRARDGRPERADAELDAVLSGGGKKQRVGGGGSGAGGAAARPSFKRAGKDKKYGFGGAPKRLAKTNDARSSASTRDFSLGRNRALPPGVKPRGGAKGSGAARPGKRSRDGARGKRSSGSGK